MIAELFSAIKSVFRPGPHDRADEIERFRARSRMRARQQRGGSRRQPASDLKNDGGDYDDEEEDDTPRRRKMPRAKSKSWPASVAKKPLAQQTYTASTYQSYLAPPAVFDDGAYPDSPVVHEHQVLMMNAFDFSESPEAFLYDDDGGDGGASSSQHGGQSLWRRRFSSGASDSAPPRLSPRLGADALWGSHFEAETAAERLRAEGDAHLHALYCPVDARGQYYD